MNISNIYQESKNSLIFNESKKFLDLREKIIKNFDLSPKVKKNNESLKYLDPEVLEFSYKYEKKFNNIAFIENSDDQINLNVTDGKISRIDKKSIIDIDVEIHNIEDGNDYAQENFLEFQKNFNNDYIVNLNSLMMNSGYEINIGKNQVVNFFISNNISEKNLTIFQKNIISCAKNSKVFIIEEFDEDKKSNTNVTNFLNIEENSEVVHFIFQKNNSGANLQSTSFANCKTNSKYKQLVINISKSSIRNHHYASLLGKEVDVSLDGIFFAALNQVIDNKTEVNHNSPNCLSSQRYKGILTDEAKASYLSKTFVNKIAQKTEAYQLSRGIILSDNSFFHSKPELKIYADDVKCSHGSTIGPIDKDLLFYLRSRGLNKKISTSFLIKSFFHDIVSCIDNKNFLEKFNYHSNSWLNINNI